MINNLRKISILFFFFISLSAWSAVIKSEAQYFKTTGAISQFTWAPEDYQSDFRYDVLYYIPDSIKDIENAKSMIFMHGGGDSTLTREGALKVANLYMSTDVSRLANELNMIVVIPSVTGLNWGGHTPYMLRKLATLMRHELNIDQNQLGLSGHSMGGMGITRSYSAMVDEFAYFVPQSAGMDQSIQTEQHLNKMFNVPYIHIQGLHDDFQIFIERCNDQLKAMQGIEAKYQSKSQFELIYYDGTHQPNYRLWADTIIRLQKTAPRDIYQKTLYGNIMSNATFYTENNIRFFQGSLDRYFWIRVLKTDLSQSDFLDFKATVVDNRIDINYEKKPERIKSIQVGISKKMVDLNNYQVFVNGILIDRATHLAPSILPDADPNFQFDEALNIDL